MAQIFKLANATQDWRDPDDWTEADTHTLIVQTLVRVRAADGCCAGMIAGGSCIGKSLAVSGYCLDMFGRGHYVEIAKGEGSAWEHAKSPTASIDDTLKWNSVAEARRMIAEKIGPDTLIVADEAQYLDQKNRKTNVKGEGFEWLRALAETAECGLVYCGDLSLVGLIARTPQLASRTPHRAIIKSVPACDLSALATGTGFEAPECISALCAVAALPGGLRNACMVLSIVAECAGDEARTARHLKAAIMDMKLAPKGGC